MALILECHSELVFQIAKEKKNIGEGIGKIIDKIQTFGCLWTDYRAKIFYEKISNLEFE